MTAAMPVMASPMATFTLPPMFAQTTLPPTSLAWPSMVTLVAALASAVVDAALELLDEDELELELEDSVDDFSADEQPARPATTTAAPPTAISRFCFTSRSPRGRCDPSRSADRRKKYEARRRDRQGIARIARRYRAVPGGVVSRA